MAGALRSQNYCVEEKKKKTRLREKDMGKERWGGRERVQAREREAKGGGQMGNK